RSREDHARTQGRDSRENIPPADTRPLDVRHARPPSFVERRIPRLHARVKAKRRARARESLTLGRPHTTRRASLTATRPVMRHPAFALFWFSRILSTLAFQMQAVAVGWQLYALTGSALDLGLVGLAQFLPI